MAETHVNAYITEAEEAYEKAIGALGEYKEKMDIVKQKLLSEISELTSEDTPTPAPTSGDDEPDKKKSK